MSNNSHKARVIPDQYLPLVEQGLLNLALKGDVRIIRDGHDITKSLTAQAGRINKAYEAALNAIRSKKSLQPKTDRPKRAVNRVTMKPGPKADVPAADPAWAATQAEVARNKANAL